MDGFHFGSLRLEVLIMKTLHATVGRATNAREAVELFIVLCKDHVIGSSPEGRNQYGTASSFFTSIHTGCIPFTPRSMP